MVDDLTLVVSDTNGELPFRVTSTEWGDVTVTAKHTSLLKGLTQADTVSKFRVPITVVGNRAAYAAIKGDGRLVTWGDKIWGGTSPAGVSLENVDSIYSSFFGFAAIRTDGIGFIWGATGTPTVPLEHVKSFAGGNYSFVALFDDGTAVSWGQVRSGAVDSSLSSASVTSELVGVESVYAVHSSFIALKGDKTVFWWGPAAESLPVEVVDIERIVTTSVAFAGIKTDGSVVCWGHAAMGGDCSGTIAAELHDVIEVVGGQYAFAALRSDGTVVTWGDSRYGADSSLVQWELHHIETITASIHGFGALKQDGTVVSWGSANHLVGFEDIKGDLTNVSLLSGGYTKQSDKTSGPSSTCALKINGKVLCWGGRYSKFGC